MPDQTRPPPAQVPVGPWTSLTPEPIRMIRVSGRPGSRANASALFFGPPDLSALDGANLVRALLPPPPPRRRPMPADRPTVYIATRLERHADHNLVRDALERLGIGCSYDWTTHGPVFREGIPRIREVAKAEMDGVLQADAVVVLLPGGRGTHAELGAALAAGKPTVLHSLTPDLHLGATSETCAFYHHPLVIPVETDPGDGWANVVAEATAPAARLSWSRRVKVHEDEDQEPVSIRDGLVGRVLDAVRAVRTHRANVKGGAAAWSRGLLGQGPKVPLELGVTEGKKLADDLEEAMTALDAYDARTRPPT